MKFNESQYYINVFRNNFYNYRSEDDCGFFEINGKIIESVNVIEQPEQEESDLEH